MQPSPPQDETRGRPEPQPTPQVTPLALMARRGRSFRLAGRLLPSAELAAVAELYAFCRQVDDLADTASDPTEARHSLRTLLAALRGTGHHPLADQFLPLRNQGVPVEAAALLVTTVLGDLDPVRVADEALLLRYAHGAAGTVGIMLCAVLRVADQAATPHAVDLGVAMQLTNIARDVAEDAAQDRLYLPATWLPRGYRPGDVARDPDPAFAALSQVLQRADRHYRSAERGFRHLPPRVRTAVRAASLLYEAIGPAVLRGGPEALAAGRRAVVPRWRRLALMSRSLLPCPSVAPHDPRLHLAFQRSAEPSR